MDQKNNHLKEKVIQVLDWLAQIKLEDHLKFLGLVLSVLTIHFVSFIYYITQTIPPFVDAVSIAGFSFVILGTYAISSLCSHALSLVYSNFVFPLCAGLMLGSRHSRHRKIRVRRMNATKGEGFVSSESYMKTRFENNIRFNHQLMKVTENANNNSSFYFRWASSTLIFMLLYLGPSLSIDSIELLLFCCITLFVFYSFISLSFLGLKGLNRRRFPDEEIWKYKVKFMFLGLLDGFRMYRNMGSAVPKYFRRFIVSNLFLIIIIAAAVIGASRGARVVDTSIYLISTNFDGVQSTTKKAVVFAKTSDGVLAVVENRFVFLPFDALQLMVFVPNAQEELRNTRIIMRLEEFLRDAISPISSRIFLK